MTTDYVPYEGAVQFTSDLGQAPPTPELALPEAIADIMAQLQASTVLPAAVAASHTATTGFRSVDPETMQMLTRAFQIRAKAPITEPVLITGPSGTGKELLARTLHHDERQPFIAVNVAALTDTLIHSTLFGHVKGSFTGAVSDYPGVFRAARGGTVFLDEIGDMPISQQPALLRVLAQRTVTPVGSTNEYPINCRIVAATNRPDEMRDDLRGRFMFRLRVKPLQERWCDVEMLADFYGLSRNGLKLIPIEVLQRYGVRAIQSAARCEQVFGSATGI